MPLGGAGPLRWDSLATTGARPSRDDLDLSAYDSVNQRLLYLGTNSDTSGYNRVWTLDLNGTPNWTSAHVAPFSPRPHIYFAECAFDEVLRRFIVVGLFDSVSTEGYYFTTNQTWALDLAGSMEWTRLATEQGPGEFPALGYQYTLCFDRNRRRLLAYGRNYDTPPDSIAPWTLDLDSPTRWQRLATTGEDPKGRENALVGFDAGGSRLALFGGLATDEQGRSNERTDLITLDLEKPNAWQVIQKSGEPPDMEFRRLTTFDPGRRRAYVFSGRFPQPIVHRLEFGGVHDWEPLYPTGEAPTARIGAVGAYDAAADRVLMYGGEVGTAELGDLWALNFTEGAASSW
jgi:hypothetical protein